MCLGSCGLSVGPNRTLSVCRSWQYAGVLVLPMMTAPWWRSRATASASRVGTWSARSSAPLVVRRPAVSKLSLIVRGRPLRTPVLSLRARRSSAACAAARAALSSRVTTALIWLASIWARCRSSSSRLEISPRSRAWSWTWAGWWVRSFVMRRLAQGGGLVRAGGAGGARRRGERRCRPWAWWSGVRSRRIR